MADTVETLKQQIVNDAYDGDCTKAQLRDAIDALIAAVRAEREARPAAHTDLKIAKRLREIADKSLPGDQVFDDDRALLRLAAKIIDRRSPS